MTYDLFFFDLAGNACGRLELDCADDQDATRVVAENIADAPMELWQGRRRVAVFFAEEAGLQGAPRRVVA